MKSDNNNNDSKRSPSFKFGVTTLLWRDRVYEDTGFLSTQFPHTETLHPALDSSSTSERKYDSSKKRKVDQFINSTVFLQW